MKILQKICVVFGLLALAGTAGAQDAAPGVYKIQNKYTGLVLQLKLETVKCPTINGVENCRSQALPGSLKVVVAQAPTDQSSTVDRWLKECTFSGCTLRAQLNAGSPYFYLNVGVAGLASADRLTATEVKHQPTARWKFTDHSQKSYSQIANGDRTLMGRGNGMQAQASPIPASLVNSVNDAQWALTRVR